MKERKDKLSSRNIIKFYALKCMSERKSGVSGKEIIEQLSLLSTVWTPSNGTLYPLLEELVRDEYIQEVKVVDTLDAKINSNYRLYVITNKGKEYYNEHYTSFKETIKETINFYNKLIDKITVI